MIGNEAAFLPFYALLYMEAALGTVKTAPNEQLPGRLHGQH